MSKRAHIEDGNARVIGFEDDKGKRFRLPAPLAIPDADALDIDPGEVESVARDLRGLGRWDGKLKATKAKEAVVEVEPASTAEQEITLAEGLAAAEGN